MKRRIWTALALGAVALLTASCGTSRLLSYGPELGDAVVRLGPAAFSVYVHPKDDTLMIQRGIGQATAVDGAQLVRIVTSQFLAPVGCSQGEPKMFSSGTWEVPFACPANVDLRALAASQRAALRNGEPLTLGTEQ